MAKIVRVVLTFWKGACVLLHLLTGDLVEEVADTVEAYFFLVIGRDYPPWCFRDVCALEHHLLGAGVVFPATARSRSIGLSFQRFSGSKIRELNRNFCSSSSIENQYLIRRIPNRTSMRSNPGTDLKNFSYSSSVQEPMTFSTPARLY